MPEKFQNKYRISSTRLQKWDYRWAGAYFITICTKDKEHFFGGIIDNKIHLSHVGIIADILWHKIKNHAEDVELDVFQVMPNHLHGILILKNNNSFDDGGHHNLKTGIDNVEIGNQNVETGVNNVETGVNNVETGHALSLPSSPQPPTTPPQSPEKTIGQKRFQNIGKNSVSSIIGSYKSAVTKHCNRLGLNFGWQPRFHDHIIRDEDSFNRIRKYILENPANWKNDKFY